MECDVKFEGKPQGLSKIKRLMPMHGNCLVSGVAGYGRRPWYRYCDFVLDCYERLLLGLMQSFT
jgi:hypothetical protein